MRQFAVGAGLINGLRQLVRQYLRDLIDRDVVLGRKLPDHVAAEHLTMDNKGTGKSAGPLVLDTRCAAAKS